MTHSKEPEATPTAGRPIQVGDLVRIVSHHPVEHHLTIDPITGDAFDVLGLHLVLQAPDSEGRVDRRTWHRVFYLTLSSGTLRALNIENYTYYVLGHADRGAASNENNKRDDQC